ncbi:MULTISPECIES: acetoacetate decarboxylase family protein [unclassified Nocardioides]|uniref:acetoacetate decarboxylase family protein n=1 Tax=unclassified Nocardioides TaxID=2615069 RepID=UPI00188625DC|nr:MULTISPECIES: acetoacetate decarboxylase family protein [unclassified Nocardioides]
MSTAYPPEPWDLTGTGLISLWRVPVDAVPTLPAGARALTLRGQALATTMLVRYDERGAMAYRELLAGVLVRHGRGVALSITDIWVDSEASMAGGRALWGVPKQLAAFDPDPGGAATGSAHAETGPVGDGPVATGHLLARRGPAVRLPFPLRARIVQTRDARTLASPIRAGGRLRLARAEWSFDAAGPLAWLRAGRMVVSVQAEEFAMRFGA